MERECKEQDEKTRKTKDKNKQQNESMKSTKQQQIKWKEKMYNENILVKAYGTRRK